MTDLLGPGDVIASRYTVLGVLGRGGMAVVYEVMNHQLGTPCALKVLALSAKSVRERLLKEGKVQSALAHPNVVSVFDVIEVDGQPGLLMELVRGPSLDRLLAETRLTFDQCDALAGGIFDGLSAAHGAGLIHRDLKPANVLCSVAGGNLIPKIGDFGLAKLLHEEVGSSHDMTRSGTTMGTPSYMAPEQIRNAGRVDQRADIFSLGAVLYELVTGRKAFSGEDLLDLYTAVAAGRFVPPRELRPDLPERMERAILGALVPDRDQRIRDCATVESVWYGQREDWTTDHPVERLSVGPWDAEMLARYSVTSHSGDKVTGTPLPKQSPRPDATWVGATEVDEGDGGSTSGPSLSSGLDGRSVSMVATGFLFLAGAGALAVVALVGALIYLFVNWPTPPIERVVVDPVPVPVPVSVPVPVPFPEPAPAPAPAPAPVAVPVPVPVVAPAPAPAPAPTPEVAPAPTPAPARRPGFHQVALQGDVESVWLQGTAGNFPLPAEVPAGRYEIQAFFAAGESQIVGTIDVSTDRTLACNRGLRKCR